MSITEYDIKKTKARQYQLSHGTIAALDLYCLKSGLGASLAVEKAILEMIERETPSE